MVSEIRVDGGTTLKRFRPRSRGLMHPIGRRTSHVTLVLTECAGEARKPVAPKEVVALAPADREQHRPSPREGKQGLREAAKARQAPRQRMAEFGRRVFRRKAM